ncbi:60S ribosomal protein L28 OS=Drosophila melanogaster GN=RpL28 PE=2 SV=1 [Rhizoctonia solani AG-1 IB]|uniref:60S ribosomal protein L28 n=1 Tax=Thanatephorus cucumeris (strain AG1-IB / isolate 7/3/14) TaxID=1108050 RepID=A0A0B7FBN2_THACB|nr:60S ribosomal protein L28 OS=Drosophila melanogaster GN=RpL28 PE=2 SV=1 [Rhizoctonia solani AG-1 IB]
MELPSTATRFASATPRPPSTQSLTASVMSTDLQWLLVRKYNSFIVKRVPEGPIFSKEPGNLKNIHSRKYSGLISDKSIHVGHNTETNAITLTSRKPKSSIHQHSKGQHKATIRARSGPRRSQGVVASQARLGYRPDLRQAALQRVSALQRAQQQKKPAPERKVRGKKAKAAAESA